MPSEALAQELAWLYDRQQLGIKLGLDNMQRLLSEIGDPHLQIPAIHVAGTNGKGTVCTLLSEALQTSGYPTGRFTSPHLIEFRERFWAEGSLVPDDELAEGLRALKPVIDKLDADGIKCTFFEVITALMWQVFLARGIELVVLETGLGGSMDATNLCRSKLTIVTSISMDHQEFLGDNIVDIAAEKAGILKPKVPLITNATGDALQVLKLTSKELEVPMAVLGEDVQLQRTPEGMALTSPFGEAHFPVAMRGEHMLENAALVVLALDALKLQGLQLPAAAALQPLASLQMPGRLEHLTVEADLDGKPLEKPVEVLMDGAHNQGAARALLHHLSDIDWAFYELIMGAAQDKDLEGMVEEWMPLAMRAHFVSLRSGRSADPEDLVAFAKPHGKPTHTYSDVREAINAALHATASGEGKVVIAGSFFLVGDARAALLGIGTDAHQGTQ